MFPVTEGGLLDEWTQRIVVDDAIIFEKHIKILLNPKPDWVPRYIWEKMIKLLLRMEVWR